MSEDFTRLLILAAIFIVLPVVEGALRRRKRGRGVEGAPAGLPEPDGNGAEAWGGAAGAGEDQKEEGASEGLPAHDLWKELRRALAQGQQPTDPAPQTQPEPQPRVVFEAPFVPSPDPESERRALPTEEFSPRSGARSTSPEVYRTHLPVPDRASGEVQRVARSPSPLSTGAMGKAAAPDAQAKGGGTAPETLLAFMRGMSATDLRRAVLFHEVLGPPISERDEDPLGGL